MSVTKQENIIVENNTISATSDGTKRNAVSRQLRNFEVTIGRLDLSGFWNQIREDFDIFLGKKVMVCCGGIEKPAKIGHYPKKKRIMFSCKALKQFRAGDTFTAWVENGKIYIDVERTAPPKE